MNALIGVCGSLCNECDAFVATRNVDDEKRAEVAKLWSEKYHADIKPEDINCTGCLSEGGCHFNYCNVCEIRKCGMNKGVVSCAYCDDYVCDKLQEFFRTVPDARKRLDNMRSSC